MLQASDQFSFRFSTVRGTGTEGKGELSSISMHFYSSRMQSSSSHTLPLPRTLYISLHVSKFLNSPILSAQNAPRR